jgi:hypothetical protein
MEESMKCNRVLMFALAIVMMAVMAPSGSAQKKSAEPVKVFVFTAANEGGFVDADQKQRRDSVGDLKKALDRKKDLIQIVTEKEAADVTLEVLGRGYIGTGNSTTTTTKGYYGVWNSTTSEDSVPTVHVGLKAGDYVTIIHGGGPDNQIQLAPWRGAAVDAAFKIEKWVKDNHDRLIAQRVQK